MISQEDILETALWLACLELESYARKHHSEHTLPDLSPYHFREQAIQVIKARRGEELRPKRLHSTGMEE